MDETLGAIARYGEGWAGTNLKELVLSGDLAVDLAAAFDASPNPYVLLKPDLTVAGLNQAYLDVTHSTREQIVGQPLFGHFTSGTGADAPENVRQVRDSMLKAIETRQPDHLALVRFSIEKALDDGSRVFEDRLWSATHTPIMNRDGEVVYLLQHTVDITELERLRELAARGQTEVSELDAIVSGRVLNHAQLVQADNRRLESERNRLVDVFMQAPGFVAILSGDTHRFQMHNAAYAQLIGHRDIAGKSIRDALPELGSQGYYELLDHVLATGEPFEGRASEVQLQRTPNAPLEARYLDFIYQPIRDPEGLPIGIFVQGHDVTNDVLAAQRQKLMIDELNHRVKNTLATVQSIAMQTARSHADPRTFAEGFQARLMALSHTHDLLTRSHWEGAALHDILKHETAAHGAARVLPNGPVVALDPPAALSLGMIFHELATNAAKYGALSAPGGRVMVDWNVSNQADRTLHLSWREIGGPHARPPERRGFGSRLIERNVRHDLAGEIDIRYEAGGLSADLSMPLDRGTRS